MRAAKGDDKPGMLSNSKNSCKKSSVFCDEPGVKRFVRTNLSMQNKKPKVMTRPIFPNMRITQKCFKNRRNFLTKAGFSLDCARHFYNKNAARFT